MKLKKVNGAKVHWLVGLAPLIVGSFFLLYFIVQHAKPTFKVKVSIV